MGEKSGNLPILEQIGVKSEGFYADLQPLHSILKERDAASTELAGYLKELGYE